MDLTDIINISSIVLLRFQLIEVGMLEYEIVQTVNHTVSEME